MKYLNILIIWFCAILIASYPNFAFALNNKALEDFVQKTKYEFEFLLSKSPPKIADNWRKEYDKYVQAFIEKSEMLQSVELILEREGKLDKGSFAYSYVNEINELHLEKLTNLVNGLGHEYFDHILEYHTGNIDSLIQDKFQKINNISEDKKLIDLLSEYFQIKREIQSLLDFPKVKYKFVFEPKSSGYSDEPEKVKEYLLYDWFGQSKEIPRLKTSLLVINDNLIIEDRIRPKDPLFALTLLTQLAILVAIIPGYILTYTDKRPVLIISSFVAVSISLSFILIFLSPSTWLNICIQSIIPCFFGIVWVISYIKERRKLN